MTVDPDKVPLPTWGDYLANVYQFDQALGVVISLRFDSASDDPEWENKPCGLAGGGGYHLVLLGFPLYYLVEEEVAAFIEHYMYVYGETAVQGESAPAPQLTLSVAPNPFNPVTTLSFSLDAPSDAVIGIYDVRGRRVLHEKLDHLSAGDHTWTWDAGAAASGVYLLRLEAGGQSVTRRAVLLK